MSTTTKGCGSNAGYQAHARAGTRPCQPCKDAHAFIMNAYRVRTDTGRRFMPTPQGSDRKRLIAALL